MGKVNFFAALLLVFFKVWKRVLFEIFYVSYFSSCRRALTQMRFLFHQSPLNPAPNRPYLPQPLALTFKSDEDTIPRLLKLLHLKSNLISSWSHQSLVSECQLRTWLNTWRSVCWIHAGENSEIECYRRRKNKSKCLLKVNWNSFDFWTEVYWVMFLKKERMTAVYA